MVIYDVRQRLTAAVSALRKEAHVRLRRQIVKSLFMKYIY